MICTFFGHRDTPATIRPQLEACIRDLIERGITLFYVGHNGHFDRMVKGVLEQQKLHYPHIGYYIVLAYLQASIDGTADTLYPEGLEHTPLRFAIDRRNRWMIDQADVVVTYVLADGGAAKYKGLAERKGKTVINITKEVVTRR